MNASLIVELVACFGHLVLAIYAGLRASESPLARSVALVAVDFFVFNAADVAGEISGRAAWDWIDYAAASYATALALDFSLELTGLRRRLALARVIAHAWFGGLGAWCLGALFFAEVRATWTDERWATLVLAGALPAMIVALVVLVRHLGASGSRSERARTRLVIAALAIMTVLGTTDLWRTIGVPVPRLSGIATLVAGALLVVAALRFRLFGAGSRAGTLAVSAILAGGVVLSYLLVFEQLAAERALFVFGSSLTTLLLLAVVRPAYRHRVRASERERALATLGRMSAQLAHDLRNPIAAIKGAAQFLRGEREAGRSVDAQAEILELLIQQADRLEEVARTYQRLGRVEADLRPLSLMPFLERLIAARRAAAPPSVRFELTAPAAVPEIAADADLLATALENLLRNAEEALGPGGLVRLSVEPRPTDRPPAVMIEIADNGAGMDGPSLSRALDDFFTTKVDGTGLGLPFVRRVVEAHGGEIDLTSAVGRGTSVRVHLPERCS
ncbi:MAG: two-component sensor histidine kinase [Deltaproteobacteria bacterium]|nr:two-component sensor histidine kinase [Deltaproteobacteria bacterium]